MHVLLTRSLPLERKNAGGDVRSPFGCVRLELLCLACTISWGVGGSTELPATVSALISTVSLG